MAYVGQNTLRVRGTFSGKTYVFSPEERTLQVDGDDSRVMLRTRFFKPGAPGGPRGR